MADTAKGRVHATFIDGVWTLSPEAYGSMMRRIAELELQVEAEKKKLKLSKQDNEALLYAMGEDVHMMHGVRLVPDTFEAVTTIYIKVDEWHLALGGVEVVREAFAKGLLQVVEHQANIMKYGPGKKKTEPKPMLSLGSGPTGE